MSREEIFTEVAVRILTVTEKSNVNNIHMEISFEVGCWGNCPSTVGFSMASVSFGGSASV
jgi:hypothetical protein